MYSPLTCGVRRRESSRDLCAWSLGFRILAVNHHEIFLRGVLKCITTLNGAQCSRAASHPPGLHLWMHVCNKGAPVLHLTCFMGGGTNSASDLPSSPSPTDRNTHKGPLGYSGFLRQKNTPWSALIPSVAATCLVIPVEDLGEAIFVGARNSP